MNSDKDSSIERAISERRRKRQKARRKKKHVRVLLAVFCCVLAATCAIGAAARFSTKVYKNDEEFREYAELTMEKSPFKMKGRNGKGL